MSGAVLVVDDEALFAEAVATRLRREGYACAVAGDLAQARAALADPIDLMLLDVRLPDGSGLDFLAEAEGVPVVMMTAFGDVDSAVAAMKGGAADYLRKPVDLDELAIVAARALAARRLEDRLAWSRERDARRGGEAELVGESPAIAAARREISAFAAILGGGAGDADPPPVLILGETGVGKTLAAKLLHRSGPEPDRPFVHVDCAGLPPGAALAELFGDDDGPGLVEAAERGAVVLDEVSALPSDAQAALVAAIEGRRLRRRSGRSGRLREIAVVASFVATSNRDLEALVEEGGFRRDLYYRLNVLTLRMPPLRDRGEDTVLLARRFIAQAAPALRARCAAARRRGRCGSGSLSVAGQRPRAAPCRRTRDVARLDRSHRQGRSPRRRASRGRGGGSTAGRHPGRHGASPDARGPGGCRRQRLRRRAAPGRQSYGHALPHEEARPPITGALAGSHGTLRMGDRKTTAEDRKKEIGRGFPGKIPADLGIDRDDFG